MKFYYPDNMEAPPMLFAWKLRDCAVIFIGWLLSLTIAIIHFSLVPLVPVTVYMALTFTFPNGVTCLTYLFVIIRFLFLKQQIYFWK